MLALVSDWTVQDWTYAVQAVASIVGALATVVVAVIVHRWSVRQVRQTVTQEINLALRSYNLAALSEPVLMAVIHGAHSARYSEAELKELFHVYYRLSVLNDIFEARRNKILPKAMRHYGFEQWVHGLCRSYRVALDRALEDPRGQSPEFVAFVRKCVANYDKAPNGGDRGQLSPG